MKAVAAILLLGVFLRHDTAFLLSGWTGMTPSGVFYVLGGAWEFTLCAVLLAILWHAKRDVWATLALAGLAIGMVESFMIVACKMALRMPPPTGMTNCQAVTGLPIGTVALTIEAMAICWIVGRWILRVEDAA